MVAPVVKIDFDDYTALIPTFSVIALMSFTYKIRIGMTAGLVLYPLFKVAAGRGRKILWMLSGLSILFYIFHPNRKLRLSYLLV